MRLSRADLWVGSSSINAATRSEKERGHECEWIHQPAEPCAPISLTHGGALREGRRLVTPLATGLATDADRKRLGDSTPARPPSPPHQQNVHTVGAAGVATIVCCGTTCSFSRDFHKM